MAEIRKIVEATHILSYHIIVLIIKYTRYKKFAQQFEPIKSRHKCLQIIKPRIKNDIYILNNGKDFCENIIFF